MHNIVLSQHGKGSIVVGRDARISGEMVSSLVIRTLQGMGLDVIDLDLQQHPLPLTWCHLAMQ